MYNCDTPVKVGVIGAGKIGALHAKNAVLYTNAKVIAIADINLAAAENLAKEVGAKKVYSSYEVLLKDPEVDAVIVSLPNNLHYDVIVKSIESGKHVFCEKPLCISSRECEDVVRRVKVSGLRLQVGFNRRFDPSYEKAKKLIDEGFIGRIVDAHSNTFDPEPHAGWEAKEELSGGIFFTSGTHDFDILRWLVGSEVKKVYAETRGMFGRDQSVVCILKFVNDVLGTVKAFEFCPYGHDVRAEIVGDKAAIRIEQPTVTFTKIFEKSKIYNDYPYWFIERFRESYMREIQEFIKCVVENVEPKVTAFDGLMSVKIAEAAKVSLKEGKAVEL
ncbi:MAG: Gfo/Idh/MocA family oxidoreductase [Nitrososphaeria archaeon]|nr:Gfo/Idh/MocA family oxidoreductase [Nitrososphaeria archaeon]